MTDPCYADRLDTLLALYGEHDDRYLVPSATGESGMCLLPTGHDGPHVWTPDSEILLETRDD